MVLGVGDLANVLVKRTPFSAPELAALRRVAEQRGFRFLYAPGVDTRTPFQAFFSAPDRAAFFDAYPFDVTPATDDRPFFFQFGRWRDVNLFGPEWSATPTVVSGRLVVLAVLIQATLLSGLLVLLPLVLHARAGGSRRLPSGRTSGFFFSLGVSFMLCEIALMQKFSLYLGHPVYGVTFVLAALLLGAGAGSLATSRLRWPSGHPGIVFGGIVGALLLESLVMPSVFRLTLGLDLPVRLAIGAGLTVPVGFLMGMPFPLGIRDLTRGGDVGQVGLAWATNGCGSVIGPIVAVLLGMDLGLTALLIAAAGGYVVAGICLGKERFGGAGARGVAEARG